MPTNPYFSNLLGAFSTTLASNIEREILKVDGITQSGATALVTIHNHPNDSIEVLRRILDLTHSGTVRLINNLVNQGFVERKKNDADKRSVTLELTELGDIKAREILSARTKATDSLLRNLSEDQIAILSPLVELMLQSVTENVSSARKICRLCDEDVCRPQGCPVEHQADVHCKS